MQLIVADLEEAGYISKHRHGRRNRYTVNPDKAFRHPAQDGHRIGPFLDLLAAAGKATTESELAAEFPNGARSISSKRPNRQSPR